MLVSGGRCQGLGALHRRQTKAPLGGSRRKAKAALPHSEHLTVACSLCEEGSSWSSPAGQLPLAKAQLSLTVSTCSWRSRRRSETVFPSAFAISIFAPYWPNKGRRSVWPPRMALCAGVLRSPKLLSRRSTLAPASSSSRQHFSCPA